MVFCSNASVGNVNIIPVTMYIVVAIKDDVHISISTLIKIKNDWYEHQKDIR